MAKKLNIGNKELWFATWNGVAYSTPQRFYGLGSTETEYEGESEIIYKDDEAYYNAEGAMSYKFTIKTAQIPLAFAEACLGWKKTREGGYSITGNFKPCCIFFKNTIMDGDTNLKTPKLHYFYKATPSAPKIETATDEDKLTENEVEIEFTCIANPKVVSPTKVPLAYAEIERTDTNATFFDRYKGIVLTPTQPDAVSTMSETGGDK